MYKDGQLAHLCYDLIFFFLHFFPFFFSFILLMIKLVSVGVHSENARIKNQIKTRIR